MSDQVPSENSPMMRGGLKFSLDVLALHVENVNLATNQTDNLSLVDTADNSPIGYVHLNTTAGGPLALSGMVTPIKNGEIGIVMFLKNETGQAVLFQEENAGSSAENRFNFNGAGDQSLPDGGSAIFLYDPHILRWNLFP